MVEQIFNLIPATAANHNRNDPLYMLFNDIMIDYFARDSGDTLQPAPLHGMVWPRVSLGNLSSYDYFCMDEFVLYSFYWRNKNNYKVFCDIGANIGSDSLIAGFFGFDVHSYEPDPDNFAVLQKNIANNPGVKVTPHNVAMSDQAGTLDFIRVKGNLNANHIAGARDYYGDADFLKVETIPFGAMGVEPDLMKINVEGHEKTVVPAIPAEQWQKTDAFIEVHNDENRQVLFAHLGKIGVNIFSQKIGWGLVRAVEEMPISNREGYVFITTKAAMPW